MSRAFPSVGSFVPAKYDGGTRAGAPTFGVLHDAETPLQAGYAASIASYFQRCTNSTSAHFMVDPVATVQMLDTARVAWHCGNGNPRSIGIEQAGYASFTTAQWTTAAGLAQLRRVAQLLVDIRNVHHIGLYWMTDQQLRDAHAGRIIGGWATHAQCSAVLGGSVHSDPQPHYPTAQLMATANQIASPPPPPPVPAPIRTGSIPTVLGDDMPTVMQAGDKPPVLVVGGLFVELHTPAEIANALAAYNSGNLDSTGKPAPVWVEPGTLNDLIAQSQRAVRGGAA